MSAIGGRHLIPYKGRGYSGSVNQNLLWQHGNAYLMDNHRAALWCWQQQLDLRSASHSLLHIDRHTDCLAANLQSHVVAMPDISTTSIGEYLGATVMLGGESHALFRWDNYLSIYLKVFRESVESVLSIDHSDGDAPDHPRVHRPRPDLAPENISYWLSETPTQWIVNVDLDFFFFRTEDRLGNEIWQSLYSNEYVDALFDQIRNVQESGGVRVITICMTPTDFTPGWQECIELGARAFRILGRDYPTL
ncbi:MAG: UPF0489 family protein [Erythrobacter sp.]